MLGYSRATFLTDLSLATTAAIISICLDLTLSLNDRILSAFFRFMLYVLDTAVMLGIGVFNNMKDGFVVFHFLRIVTLLFASSFAV